MTFIPGVAITVVEYQAIRPVAGYGLWKPVCTIAGSNRAELAECALEKFFLREISLGIAAQLGPFLTGANVERIDFAPEIPNTTTDRRGGTLFFNYNVEVQAP